MFLQLLKISNDTKLQQLSNLVGDRNLEAVLALNNLKRTPNIGKSFLDATQTISQNPNVTVDRYTKMDLLNTVTHEADIFESMALQSVGDWKVTAMTNTLSGMLRLPDSVKVPDSVNTVGNHQSVKSRIYQQVMSSFKATGDVDPSVFSEYTNVRNTQMSNASGTKASNPFQWFQLPWGKISLFSSIDQSSVDFPVFPEEASDSYQANYTTMPDMLYQYEPWQVYQSSGPRSNTYTFLFHRDMWTGDHTDGKANELIRFCEANCYPEFKGSAVVSPTVTLYISGQPHISGVLTTVDVKWSGPLGRDNWYLFCELAITITEVSATPLNYSSMKQKGII